MGNIPLTLGLSAVVDDEDLAGLSEFKWTAAKRKAGVVYAYRQEMQNGKKVLIYMHRLLVSAEPGQIVDHIDGDGLNNTKANLRVCTNAQNSQNKKKTRGSSQFKGVCLDRRRGKWLASIYVSGKHKCLGRFAEEEAAAMAYNEAANIHFGDFARLNEVALGGC